ncbi:hypothetical protein [Kitasatospora sp. NPDC091207]|uniref:hypothetical protein n=1 Tax=Kitasatospora sp. NPDC091207 TaxID=3364083 RepID=UPI0038107F06
MTTEPNAATPPAAAASSAGGATESVQGGLGPLVRVDGRWTLGDHQRRAHLTFEPEGLVHRVLGRDPHLVTWDRLMELGVAVTVDRFSSSRIGGLLSKSAVSSRGSCLRSMVRHPYDLWSPEFTHHRGFYSAREISLLDVLLGTVVGRKRAELLGDDAWLTSAVHRMAEHHFTFRWRSPSEAVEIVDGLLSRTP